MAISHCGEEFVVIEVTAAAPEAPEAMGSKPKFWFQHEELGRCLYKQARPGGGEDWAEKIACELCKLLGIPHAHYELASWRGLRGTVSLSFLPANAALLHGNEILVESQPDYPRSQSGSRGYCRVPQHTLDAVLSVIGSESRLVVEPPFDWDPPPDVVDDAGKVFLGYLMLDAWIGNQDRHHENWGLVLRPATEEERKQKVLEGYAHLAPTYDHASSLGCNETDETRQNRLTTTDEGYTVRAYVEKARSKLFARTEDVQPLTTLDAFRQAASRFRAAARVWLDRLANVSESDTMELLRRIPSDRISGIGIDFTQEVLKVNRRRLVEHPGDLT